MSPLSLLDMNDDVLRVLCETVAHVHPPHSEFPTRDEHDWQPSSALTDRPPDADISENRMCLGWIFLSHVCRRLRSICLDSPHLWAEIILALPSPSSWPEFIDRARSAPLTFRVPSGRCDMSVDRQLSTQYTRKLRFIEDRVQPSHYYHVPERIMVLETSVDNAPPYHWYRVFNGTLYPILRSLSIYEDTEMGSTGKLKVNAPSLVHVVVKNTVPTFSSSLRLLQSLTIHLINGMTLLGSDATILNILSGTPLLTRLDLKLQLHPSTGSLTDHIPTFHLPIALDHLKEATIRLQGLVDLGLLWPSIQAPEEAFVSFVVLGNYAKQNELLNALSRQMCHTRYNYLTIRLDSVFFFVITSLACADSRVMMVQRGAGINDAFELLCQYTNTQNIESLSIRVESPYDAVGSASVLHTFLRAYSAVTTLALDTDAHTTGPLYRLLAENARAASSGEDALFLPALYTLSVARTSDWFMTDPKMVETHWNDVFQYLEARALTGKRVRRLEMSGGWAWMNTMEGDVLREMEKDALGRISVYVEEIADQRFVI